VQAAIDARPDQRTFAVCRGEYPGNLTLTRDVELIGARDGFTMLTTIRGDGTTSVITIPDLGQNVALSQMNVTGGIVSGTTPSSTGGGIRNEGRTLTMTDCVITANRAFIGGGLYAPGGSPSRSVDMTRCRFELSGSNDFNSAGGGIFNGSEMTLRDCEVGQNTSFLGGGINNDGTLTLFTTFVDQFNGAQSGGGIYNSGILVLHASKVTQNGANPGNGGGIFNTSPGTVTLADGSVVCGNFGGTGNQCAGFSDPACQNTCPA
jgi:hypothetical protein